MRAQLGGSGHTGDGTATGTITNDDTMPQAWLAPFGRTVAEQAMKAVEGRLRASPGAGSEVSLAGERIGLGALFADGAAPGNDLETTGRQASAGEAGVQREAARLAEWLAGETDLDRARPGTSRAVTGRELLLGSSFSLTGGSAETGYASFWGRGAATRFDGREGEMTLDGEVTSAMLGADFSADALLAGVVVSHSRGEGGYRSDAGRGTIDSTLTALYPYGRYALSERLTVWGMAGYGEGTLTQADQAPLRPGMDFAMAPPGCGACWSTAARTGRRSHGRRMRWRCARAPGRSPGATGCDAAGPTSRRRSWSPRAVRQLRRSE